MEPAFKTLFEFIAAQEGEVSGRALLEPTAEEATQLERFARGECSPSERTELCVLLRSNPAALRWLAARVKRARAGAGEEDGRLASA